MEPNTCNMDGAVQMYDVLNPSDKLTSQYTDNMSAEDWAGAVGKKRRILKNRPGVRPLKKLVQGIENANKRRLDRKDLRAQTKSQVKLNKSGAKLTQAEAQKEAARGLADPSADIALSKSLAKMSSGPTPSAAKKGLSTLAWVGIGVSVIAIGVGAYFVFKKK